MGALSSPTSYFKAMAKCVGFVIIAVASSNLSIDKTRMDWVITNEQRYNIAMITFDRSPVQSSSTSGCSNTDSYIPLTLQTSNFIGVQSYLTLTLDIGGLSRGNNETGINTGGN